MSQTSTIYYDVKRDGDIGKAIDELINSPYFQSRSRGEVTKLVLVPALARKIKKYKINNEKEYKEANK